MKIDKYFMRSALIRKDLLPGYVPELLPPTYLSSKALADTEEYWIVKYADSSNGFGIELVHRLDDARLAELAQDGCRVYQKYLAPKLDPIHQTKFHIRTIVLAVGKLKVYVYDEMRVLSATEPYVAPDATDIDHGFEWNPYVHLTNQSVNQKHVAYDSARQNQSLKDFFPTQHEDIRCQIQSLVRQVFGRVSQDPKKFFALPNCYEVFGFDFMMDHQDKLWLLEINPDPSPALFPQVSSFEACIGGPSVLTSVPVAFERVFCLESFHAMQTLKEILK